MKTYFGLIADYDESDAAVQELYEHGFRPDQINVIIQEDSVKNSIKAGLNRIKVDKSEELGQPGAHGLDGLLGGEQAIAIPDVGHVYASGELANMLTGMAAVPGSADAGLKRALTDFNLSPEAAEFLREGVSDGKVLFFIRADDERALEAASILSAHKAEQLTTTSG